jgi:hypothetical protein
VLRQVGRGAPLGAADRDLPTTLGVNLSKTEAKRGANRGSELCLENFSVARCCGAGKWWRRHRRDPAEIGVEWQWNATAGFYVLRLGVGQIGRNRGAGTSRKMALLPEPNENVMALLGSERLKPSRILARSPEAAWVRAEG